MAPCWQSARKMGPWAFNSKELNAGTTCEPQMRLENASPDFQHPEQRTPLSLGCCTERKCALFKAAKCVEPHPAVGEEPYG